MALAGVNIAINNTALGQTPASPGSIVAVFGATSLLTDNVPTSFSGSAINLIAAAGYGPGADLACNLVAGGSSIYLTSVANTATSPGAVTHTGTGLSVMTTTGTVALDRYDVIVEVTRAGTAGTDPEPGFRLSLDNGNTWTGEIRVPADRSYEGHQAMTGLVLVFSAATMVVGDAYKFSVGAPTVTAAQVVTAIDAFTATNFEASIFYVCGAFNRTDATTIANAFATYRATKRFARLIIECVDENSQTKAAWVTALDTDWSGFASDVVAKCAGYFPIYSTATKSYLWRSIGWPLVVRLANIGLARMPSAPKDGPLTSVFGGGSISSELILPTGKFVYDSNTDGLTLDNGRFITTRSWPTKPRNSWYITTAWLSSSPTSDFRYIPHGRVMDEACRLTVAYFTDQVDEDLLVNTATGFIAEKEASRLENDNDAILKTNITDRQQCSAAVTSVSRVDDILTTETVTVTVSIVPKGYSRNFSVTMTFARSV